MCSEPDAGVPFPNVYSHQGRSQIRRYPLHWAGDPRHRNSSQFPLIFSIFPKFIFTISAHLSNSPTTEFHPPPHCTGRRLPLQQLVMCPRFPVPHLTSPNGTTGFTKCSMGIVGSEESLLPQHPGAETHPGFDRTRKKAREEGGGGTPTPPTQNGVGVGVPTPPHLPCSQILGGPNSGPPKNMPFTPT